MKITVEINRWKLPGPPVHMEGKPAPAELEREKAEAAAARKIWKPSPEAYALLEQLREFIGSEVRIQGWDPIMFWFEDDGPETILATCVDVITREEDGLVRGYLAIKDPRSLTGTDDKIVLWQLIQDGNRWLFGLDKLYVIED